MIIALWRGFADEAQARQFVRHEIRYLKSHDMRCELVESPEGQIMIRFVLQDYDMARMRFQQISRSHPGLVLRMRDDENAQQLELRGGEMSVRPGPPGCLEPSDNCFRVREVLYETFA